jgi:hypothetical protein
VSATGKIENQSSKKLSSEEEKKIPRSGFSEISNALNEEKSSSIQLLNDSTQQLMTLAKDLTKKNKEGVPAYNIDVAVKCLSEVRSTLKTKLEYLKFAKELNDEN